MFSEDILVKSWCKIKGKYYSRCCYCKYGIELQEKLVFHYCTSMVLNGYDNINELLYIEIALNVSVIISKEM